MTSIFYALWPWSILIALAIITLFVGAAIVVRRQRKRDEDAPLKDE